MKQDETVKFTFRESQLVSQIVNQQDEELATLRQQLAEEQRDAARYRWLRDGGLYKWFDSTSNVSLINLDAAIDNAMREGK